MDFRHVFILLSMAVGFTCLAKDKRYDSVDCDVTKQAYGSVLECGEGLYSVKQGSSVEKSLYQICKANFKCKISFEANKRDEVTKILSAFSKGKKKAKTYTTSFDCAEANGFAEQTVCEDEALAKLDNQMGAKLKLALETSETTKKIRDAQKAWLKERNKCQDKECLLSEYKKRLADFKSEEE